MTELGQIMVVIFDTHGKMHDAKIFDDEKEAATWFNTFADLHQTTPLFSRVVAAVTVIDTAVPVSLDEQITEWLKVMNHA